MSKLHRPRKDHRKPDFDYMSQWTGSFTDRVRVVSFAFGCPVRQERRPNTTYIKQYSNEIEQECEDEDCYFLFDDVEKYHYVRIRMGGHNHEVAQNIVISLENLEEITVVDGERWTMLTLRRPPSFDTEPNHPALEKDETIEKYRYRTRYPCLNRSPDFTEPIEAHQRVAPYASRVLFLQFHYESDFESFERQAKHFSLPTISRQMIDVDTRQLYSTGKLHAVKEMIRKIPFAVAYQCDALIRNGLLNPVELCSLETHIRDLINTNVQYAVDVLRRYIVVLKQYESDQTITSETLFGFAVHDHFHASRPITIRARNANDHMCAQITCTPSSVFLAGPEPNISNRVLRWYPQNEENFMRVTLADEDKMPYRFAYEVDNSQEIYNKVIKQLLLDGLSIGGRHFQFLGYSMSALRMHTFWFMNPFKMKDGTVVDLGVVLRRVGNFSDPLRGKAPVDHYPALYPARAAQAFSATEASILVRRSEIWEEEEDITRNGYNFTDGVGRLSLELAKDVWDALMSARRYKHSTAPPSAFQIRLCGFKGVLVVDYRLSGREIHFRKSQKKFDVYEWDDPHRSWPLEIAMPFDRPSQMHLNRPLIMLLENNGVKPRVFLRYQRAAVREAEECLMSSDGLCRIMERYGLGSSYAASSLFRIFNDHKIFDLDNLSVLRFAVPGFIHRLAQLVRVHVLRELKHHARIPIPNAWTIVGVADEWDMLDENEVYACIQEKGKGQSEPIWLEGLVLISRSPTIHPGDAQFAKAIGRPPCGSLFEHHPLPNILVFSVKGERDLPSQLGGGDLDGDVYSIITVANEDLFMVDAANPGEYEAVERKVLDRAAKSEDVVRNLVEYIDHDVVGLVATNHLLIADMEDFGLNHLDCLKLSELHSQAVDYPKTGVPVKMGDIPRPKASTKPDWNAGELRDPNTDAYYVSKKAVGKLFRDIKMPDPPASPQGNLMPAFQRVLEAAAEGLGPPPRRQWPERPTAEQRLHPSNYPPLPVPGLKPSFVGSGRQHKIANPPSTTIKIVHNGGTSYNKFRNAGISPSESSPNLSRNLYPVDPPGIPVGPPPGLGYVSEPSFTTGLDPSPQLSGSDNSREPTAEYDSDGTIQRITNHLKTLAAPYVDLDLTSKEMKQDVQLAYGRYVIELQHVSVAVALAENLTEEELVAGTIIAKCQQTRRRRQLKERMRTNVRDVVLQLRHSITGEEDTALPLHERLLRAYAGYFVAARDAEENVWGAASMCLVSLGVFCDTLEALQKKDVEFAERLANEVEASRVEGELAQENGE